MEKKVGAYGVTYDEFWHGDMDIVKYKMETFNAMQEVEVMKLDVLAWYTGMYVKEAIGSAFSKNYRYPQAPMSKKKAKTQEEKAIEQFNILERWRKKTTNKAQK